MAQAAPDMQKVKMQVEVHVQKVHLPVTESKTIFVRWIRGKNKLEFKKKTVSPDSPTVEFTRKEACSSSALSFTKNSDGTFLQDKSQCILLSGEDVIGTLNFDLSSYINKEPAVETAQIFDKSIGQPFGESAVLSSDVAEDYPGAYLEYRISVKTKEPQPDAASASSKNAKKPN